LVAGLKRGRNKKKGGREKGRVNARNLRKKKKNSFLEFTHTKEHTKKKVAREKGKKKKESLPAERRKAGGEASCD